MLTRRILTTICIALFAGNASASSDIICTPEWRLDSNIYDRCSTLPILSPGNDTRANLKLLLVDSGQAVLSPKPPGKEEAEFGYGTTPYTIEHFENRIFSAKDKVQSSSETATVFVAGSRCDSNEGGKVDLAEAIRHSSLPPQEQRLLLEMRQALAADCSGNAGKNVTQLQPLNGSPMFMQFKQYIGAAGDFYAGNFERASSGFKAVAVSTQPWLKEAATYMLGRTALNMAQQNAFDEYGFADIKKSDRSALAIAEQELKNYLKQYPEGDYAASARGLLRRVYWLGSDTAKLAAEYDWQLSRPASPQHTPLDQLVLELDHKLMPDVTLKQIRNPLLLAMLDLSMMRRQGKQLTFNELTGQQKLFSQQPALHKYLLAAHLFHVQNKPAEALKQLPESVPSKMSYLDFSAFVLRGLALEATGNNAAALKLWQTLLLNSKQPLQNETLQLAIAIHHERNGKLAAVFANGSPVTDPVIRRILITNSAPAPLLRQIAGSGKSSREERENSIYTLLLKDLMRGRYQDYLKDYRLLPGDTKTIKRGEDQPWSNKKPLGLFKWSAQKTEDSLGCASTLEMAGRLAKDPSDPRGLLCMGDFVYSNGLQGEAYYGRQSATRQNSLGSSDSFGGKTFLRGEAYRKIIDDAAAPAELKAYALYRAIRCYAPAGYNQCGDKEVDKSIRKGWFRILKSRYADTTWGRSLKYYW